MTISINWATDQVIFVPKADMTLVQVSPEIRELDVNVFHQALRDLEADGGFGGRWPQTHNHIGESTLSGIVYARSMEVLAPYTVEFEAGTYGVSVVGGNTNLLDVKVPNSTSLLGNNSAGLVNLNNILSLLNYQGSVWVSAANGVAGTIKGVNGTPSNPADNLADAFTLLDSLGVRSIRLLDGSFTLPADFTTSEMQLGAEASIDLGGFDIGGSTFIGGSVTGVQGGGGARAAFEKCELSALTGLAGQACVCGVSGLLSLAVGQFDFVDCHSDVVGIGTPTLDFVGPGRTASIRGWNGGFEIRNMIDGTNVASIDVASGQVIVDSSCTAGTLVIRDGMIPLTDNSAGTTIVAGTAADRVWDALQAGNTQSGTMGELLDDAATKAAQAAALAASK